jgi:ribosomal protein L19E
MSEEQVIAVAEVAAVEWITAKEASRIHPGGTMTDANVRRLIYEGKIEAYQPDGSGPWKINKASFLAYQPGPTSSRGRRGGHRSQI